MSLGLLKSCILAVFRHHHSRSPAASSMFISLLALTIVLQPNSQFVHHAHAATWGRPGVSVGEGDGERGHWDVELAHDHREPVPAGIFHWSDYGAWTTCTATCGTGVEGRRRVCLDERNADSRPEYCIGHEIQYRLCRIQNCPNTFEVGYRASRCQQLAPPGARWKPYYPSSRDGYSPCVLACYDQDNHGEVQILERQVPRGTRCARFRNGVPETGVCIDDTCLSVGCDGYLNSTKYQDRCGVCGGDGSTCSLISDVIISENLQVGYIDVIDIPVGATNIEITEIHSVRNYLALSNEDGEYYVNGDWSVAAHNPNPFRAAGTWVRYTRRNIYTNGQWEERESVTAKGPTNQTLHLQLFNMLYGSSNTLRYAYVIPIETSTLSTDQESISPTQASQTLQTFSISIEDDDDDEPVDTLLETAFVIHAPVYVNITDVSSIGHKTLDTYSSEESAENDVQSIIRNRTLSNVNANVTREMSANFESKVTKLERADSADKNIVNRTEITKHMRLQLDALDEDLDLSRTNFSRGRVLLDPLHQVLGQSVKIGSKDEEGALEVPRRWPEVASLEGRDPGKIIIEGESQVQSPRVDLDLESGETRAGPERSSGLVYGPPYRTDDSPDELTTGNTSTTTRDVQTQRSPHLATVTHVIKHRVEEDPNEQDIPLLDDDEPVIKQHEGDNRLDYESQAPEDIDSDHDYVFSSSAVENGIRYTTRSSRPIRKKETTPPVRTTTPQKMTPNTTPTIKSTTTIATTSPPTTSLSTTATTSRTTTRISTREPTTTGAATTTRPAPTHFWRVTSTMPCSATCERGIIRNYAYCVDSKERQVDDTRCDWRIKPDVIAKECAGQPCEPRWETGEWSNCLGDCESSLRFRTVKCWLMMGPGLDTTLTNEQCNMTTRPNISKPCDENRCRPQWVVSDWSSCLPHCGEGQQTRQVTCSEVNGCDEDNKPEVERRCNEGECMWSTDMWSPCTGSSGHCGYQSRRVYCSAEANGMQISKRSCSGLDKPLTIRQCIRSVHHTRGGQSTRECPVKWVPQTWGECEGNCSVSFIRRHISCQSVVAHRMVVHSDAKCEHRSRPGDRLACTKASCPPQWTTSPWRPCSVSCGTGVETRDVQCKVGRRISDKPCNRRTRPVSERTCRQRPCVNMRMSNCRDREGADCDLIVRAGLCRYSRYSATCCRSCSISARSGTRGRN